MATKRKLWDRNADGGEGPRAYDVFLTYLSLGVGRSCPGVAEATGRRLATVSMLCAKFKWVQRAKAYDAHLHRIQQKAIENKVKSESVIWIEREYEHRHEAYTLSEKLFAKAAEMLQAPLYVTEIIETQEVTVGDETVVVDTKIIKKPVRWNFKDMTLMQEFADKLRRMALQIPTSRMAVEVSPAQTLEERITQARSAMKFYIENKLERAIQRIIENDPSQDPNVVRQSILNELPIWQAQDYSIPDPLMLTEYEEPPPLSLDEEQPQEVGEGVN